MLGWNFHSFNLGFWVVVGIPGCWYNPKSDRFNVCVDEPFFVAKDAIVKDRVSIEFCEAGVSFNVHFFRLLLKAYQLFFKFCDVCLFSPLRLLCSCFQDCYFIFKFFHLRVVFFRDFLRVGFCNLIRRSCPDKKARYERDEGDYQVFHGLFLSPVRIV